MWVILKSLSSSVKPISLPTVLALRHITELDFKSEAARHRLRLVPSRLEERRAICTTGEIAPSNRLLEKCSITLDGCI
jgi:hypothetical protein